MLKNRRFTTTLFSLGLIAGLAGWPKMRRKHQDIEATRRVPDEYLESLMTHVSVE